MNLKSLAFKLILWISCAILFSAIMELSARVDDYLRWDAPLWKEYSEDQLANTDTLGYRNVPNARFQKWHINSHGFRGPEITREKPSTMIRIMVVGASETFGLYESEGMEYPSQLQTILDSEYPGKFQVINAASAGMSMPRLIRFYKDFLHLYSPDIVIYYPTPAQYLSTPPPQAETTKYVAFPVKRGFKSRLLPKLSILMKKAIPPKSQDTLRRILIYRAVKNHPPNWVIQHPPDNLFPLMRSHLAELTNLIRASGAKLIVGTHGNIFGGMPQDIDQILIIGARKLRPEASETCIREIDKLANQTIRDFCTENSVEVADIESAVPKHTDYFADHVHFTDRGAELAAESFKNSIRELMSQDTTFLMSSNQK